MSIFLARLRLNTIGPPKIKILATPMEGGKAVMLSEKVHLLSFEETVGVVALRLEVDI